AEVWRTLGVPQRGESEILVELDEAVLAQLDGIAATLGQPREETLRRLVRFALGQGDALELLAATIPAGAPVPSGAGLLALALLGRLLADGRTDAAARLAAALAREGILVALEVHAPSAASPPEGSTTG